MLRYRRLSLPPLPSTSADSAGRFGLRKDKKCPRPGSGWELAGLRSNCLHPLAWKFCVVLASARSGDANSDTLDQERQRDKSMMRSMRTRIENPCNRPIDKHGLQSLASDLLSPESTVTSLLSSSGHLRSSLLPPEHSTFRYRDKNYDSASEALDAYIADFEMSQENSIWRTGRLVLPHMALSTPSRPRVRTLRNKDVLRESLTDRELDFLNLPVSSLCHRDNRDRLSMTTDELLSIPWDGSMPVTHTSAFIQGLMSQSGASQPHSSFRPVHRTYAGLRSNHTNSQMNNHPHLMQTPRSSRYRRRPDAATPRTHDDILSRAHRAAGSEKAEPSTRFYSPHWFTSNKTDMDCSGMGSVPDRKHPGQTHYRDCNEAPPPESELWDDYAPRTRAPSWVAELEDDDPEQTLSQADSQQTLRDLRLQFAEQISLLTAGTKQSDIMETLFRDNRFEGLIQKADQVLNSLSQSSNCAGGSAGSVNTEEQMLSSRSQTQQRPVDSAAVGVTEALTDGGAQGPGCSLHENNIWKQPGPVEALKQMFFRLQAVEAELLRQQEASVAPAVSDRKQTAETPVKQKRPEDEPELEIFSGGLSLQRALHHLSCLKLLVEEPRAKPRAKEEKDDDEGLYSSSSVDGLVCTQHKSC
ncbi:hypothetical protein Q5P01_024366 [Channa striata]|uniref:Lung adenoma susceptibility protein 2 n=1 Tax=Channa striata TaxID=64152 RepID=A0AA88J7R9_CHASR|nr:hypothetical protein Q5P01_024366 [Channa striata]